ncbi:unnamed protein product [marine sediment metagenome]|uniref:Uncharacterized protein n=1 Tax=marine sediment metagenome TaxID=412755 RepID=X1GXB7_9ZZZZ
MSDSTKSQARPAKKDPTTATVEREEPFKREAFGGRSQRLGVPEEHKDPGYFYYWFRDEGDNCYRARRAGYQEVTFSEVGRIPDRDGHDNDPCVAHGGVGEAGRPYKMVLMKLPNELRAEDKLAQEKLTDDVDEAIYRQEFGDNTYGTHNVQSKDEE